MKRTAIPRRYLTDAQKIEVCDRQHQCCAECGERFDYARDVIEYDHIKELWEGGTNDLDNWQALHGRKCHKPKTAAATTRRAKADRMERKQATTPEAEAERERRAAKKPKIQNRGWNTQWKKTVDGRTVRR